MYVGCRSRSVQDMEVVQASEQAGGWSARPMATCIQVHLISVCCKMATIGLSDGGDSGLLEKT
jgi:hypothetical protein